MPALVAFAGTLALLPAATLVLRRIRAFDHPTPRSSHTSPTLRGGGIAPAAALLVALAITDAVPAQARLYVALTAAAFGAIGLAEDVRGIDVFARLGLQGVASLAALPLAGLLEWPAWAGVLIVLWVMAFVNAFNFMDGINGISCACAFVAGAAWWVVGDAAHVEVLAVGGLVAAAAALGFGPVNLPSARMFLGDTGSYFLGAWLAVLAVVGLGEGAPPEAVVAPLAVYVADTGTTLLRRIARGERWHEAHADHAYQRLVRAGWSHTTTTVFVAGVMAVVATLGMLAFSQSGAIRAAGDLGILIVVAGYLWLPGRIAARRDREAALAR